MSLLGDLSPAQALILTQGGAMRAARVLRTALLGLIGRRAVRVTRPASWRWMGPAEARLSCAPEFRGALREDEQALFVIVGRMSAEANSLSAFLSAARFHYGTRFRGFRDDVAIPPLIRAGLAEWRQTRLLGILPRRRLDRTPAGDREAARIEAGLDALRRVPELLRSAKAEAVALILAAGGATLLVAELEPHLSELRQAMDEAGVVEVSADISFDDWNLGFDVVDFGGDFDAAAGDGGGGDGGGGDGGGD